MKVPNCEGAFVPLDKITGYLLNADHTDGSAKAQFFSQLGFDKDSLGAMLLLHVFECDYFEAIVNPFGIKYVVFGQAESPLGVRFNLKSIWIIQNDETAPRLITAYPSKK